MDDGFIIIHRKIRKLKWLYRDSKTYHLFTDLILSANHKRLYITPKGLKLKRGQVSFSRSSCSERTGLSDKEIRTRLIQLEEEKMIKKEITGHVSIITIVNYNKYQIPLGEEKGPEVSTLNLKGPIQGRVEPIETDGFSFIPLPKRAIINNINNIKNNNQEEEIDLDYINEVMERKSKEKGSKPLSFNGRGDLGYRLGEFLLKHVKRNKPDSKWDGRDMPNIDQWGIEMENILDDGRDEKIIVNVIRWCQNRKSFWWDKIRNPQDLRRNFDRLQTGMMREISREEEEEDAREGYMKLCYLAAARSGREGFGFSGSPEAWAAQLKEYRILVPSWKKYREKFMGEESIKWT